MEIVPVDIIRTQFLDFQNSEIRDCQLSEHLTKNLDCFNPYTGWTMQQKHNFLEIVILVQWKPRYHYPTFGDISRYLQSCAAELKFPGTFGSDATSGDPALDSMFPGTVGSAEAKKFWSCPNPPKDQTRRPPGRLTGGSGGAEPPQ